MWPTAKNSSSRPSIHLDHASGPEYDDGEKKKFNAWIGRQKEQMPDICCDRFMSAIKEREIKFSYSNNSDVDETAWYVEGMWHIYYCPFCGKNVKGGGFGSFDRSQKENSVENEA